VDKLVTYDGDLSLEGSVVVGGVAYRLENLAQSSFGGNPGGHDSGGDLQRALIPSEHWRTRLTETPKRRRPVGTGDLRLVTSPPRARFYSSLHQYTANDFRYLADVPVF